MSDQIKKQLDFYFSNPNLRTDKFLQGELQKNNNKIKASTILLFNNMKKLNATIKDLKDAVKTSMIVEYEIIDDTKTEDTKNDDKISTNTDDFYIVKIIDDEYNKYFSDKEIENRILIIKGFDTKLELKDIEKQLEKYFDFTVIRMRRDYNQNFKGSVFVELEKSEDVENVLKMRIPIKNEEKSVKKRKIENDEEKENKTENNNVVDNYLLIKRKEKYFKDKKEEKERKKEKTKKEILEKFKGKYYKFESEANEIKTIKEIVEDIAFVDIKNKVLRMKKEKEFEDKEYEKDGVKVKLTKLNEKEAEKYAENINFKSVAKNKKKKNKKQEKRK